MRPEDALQRSVVSYFELLQAQGRLKFAAIPNAAKRSYKTAAYLKNLGMVAGAPDLMVWLAPKPIRPGIKAPPEVGKVLAIELKAGKGKLSEAQIGWQAWLKSNGFHHYVARSLQDVINILSGA
ncbi:VRR-NUC domain containing protein [uncultured Caudovirales phage]|uniref:VRR-NUC domain containing protein n=1 Tax=uncultured Caudovirales phage TaxID=2100421 RepID=A0A6J5S539_9CAUD|nr:VRR-NUC domain containing protein [uncultured Caudovirales phage]CAB4220703.1 VRR-NUC domain containing protein [uncultured Caudovirales phage]